MKYLFSFLILFSSLGLVAQYEVAWEYSLAIDSSGDFTNVLITSDGGYLVSGYVWIVGDISSQLPFHSNAYMLRLSSEGDFMWQKFYGGMDNDQARSAIEVSDGFVFSGYVHSTDLDINVNGDSDVWLVKIDFDGEIIWKKAIGGLEHDSAFDLTATQDGGVVITGSSKSTDAGWPNVGLGDLFFAKVSSDGELEIAKSFGTEFYDAGLKILEESNGDILIGGSRSKAPSGIYTDPDFTLTKLNAQGELIWQNKYEGLSTDNILSAIEIIPNVGYVLAGDDREDALISLIDLDGNEMWKQRYGGIGLEKIWDINLTDEGHLLALGYTNSDSLGLESDESKLLIVKMDMEGNELSRLVYGDSLYRRGTRVLQESDGSLITAGLTFNSEFSSRKSVMKLNKNTSSILPSEPSPVIRLFPNPVSEKINLQVSFSDVGSSYFIYNSNGQVCATGKVTDADIEINTIELLPGDYTFLLRQGHKESRIQFIKL